MYMTRGHIHYIYIYIMSSPQGAGTDQGTLKRLVEDVYGGDVAGAFREYVRAEEAWSDAAAFLELREARPRPDPSLFPGPHIRVLV